LDSQETIMAYLAKPMAFGSHRIGIISSYLNTQDKAEDQVIHVTGDFPCPHEFVPPSSKHVPLCC
jgi:hypothetical protein